ncbi:winged helix-turn-helix domain-containing protein [Dactylosporangium fulvum]|uniref:Winged helix-turn-helix domain-containing protein n=1 Tax=Dactylosporangium fulvum TaxID=53359 RepID=A0ABY5W8R6_9ACTN|nr:winged helix-turn-helix domain-containing protein [Dactylosporangium fulvum]UWP85755.1 winged helix-turn-helix domain-containing protein [Dactylosporangium fulvum]
MPKRETYTDQIVREIVEGIASGRLAPGDALPSQRELCKCYGVSRSTVQRALRLLHERDLVESHQGVAVYVRKGGTGSTVGPVGDTAVRCDHAASDSGCPQCAPATLWSHLPGFHNMPGELLLYGFGVRFPRWTTNTCRCGCRRMSIG